MRMRVTLQRARRFVSKLRYKSQNTKSRFQVYKCRYKYETMRMRMTLRRARRFKYKLRYKNQNTESRFQVYKCRMQIQVRNNLNKNDLAKSQAIRARLMMTNMRRSTTQTIRGQDWWSYFFMVLIRFLWSSVF